MNSVQHIALNCRDRIRQESFYSKHFGFQRSRVLKAGTPNEFVQIRLGSTSLELFPAQDDGQSRTGGEQPVGFRHLALGVADLDSVISALQADGIETEAIIDASAVQKGLRICFFNDPEGNRIELMEDIGD